MRLAIAVPDADCERRDAIKHIRRTATGVLAGLATVFLASLYIDDPGFAVLLLRAMAEAGMVGGLADWFAVEALFRRPLGLPIPHTALLPSNQQRAARAVADFFQRYFLDHGQIRGRVLDLQPTRRTAIWLRRSDNSTRLTGYLVEALSVTLRNAGTLRLGNDLRQGIRAFLLRLASDKDLTGAIADLLGDSVRGDVTDRLLKVIREAVDQNRQKVTAVVRDRSRWWIANRVDDELAGLLVNGVLSVIDELSIESSTLRNELDRAVAAMFDRLGRDGTLEMMLRGACDHAFDSGKIEGLWDRIEAETSAQLARQIISNSNSVAGLLAGPLRDMARRLANDRDACTEMDLIIADAAGNGLVAARPALGNYVFEVIAGWNSDELVDKFETEVGRDLQFIRINGAVLGTLLGGVIFVLAEVLG